MDYSSYMETIILRTAAMLGFRRLQSYMLPCLYALLLRLGLHVAPTIHDSNKIVMLFFRHVSLEEIVDQMK